MQTLKLLRLLQLYYTLNLKYSLGDCSNTEGSYDCICQDGYGHTDALKPFECFDIDECIFFNACQPNGNCSNSIGSFECLCEDGYAQTNYSQGSHLLMKYFLKKYINFRSSLNKLSKICQTKSYIP